MRKFMALASLLTLLTPECGWSQAQSGKTKASPSNEPAVASASGDAPWLLACCRLGRARNHHQRDAASARDLTNAGDSSPLPTVRA